MQVLQCAYSILKVCHSNLLVENYTQAVFSKYIQVYNEPDYFLELQAKFLISSQYIKKVKDTFGKVKDFSYVTLKIIQEKKITNDQCTIL